MKIITCNNYDEMSMRAAEIIRDQIKANPCSKLGLATGATPIGTYKCLAKMCSDGEISFAKTVTYNLDEYYPISNDNNQSYHYFMKEQFFKHIDICPENTHLLDGETDNPALECARFEEEIKSLGGMDIQILGIGRNGHIGFNEPGDCLITGTHMTALAEDTIDANSRFFERTDMVPTHALTMGMSTIMTAKKIILLANGRSKLEAIRELFSDNITTSTPATLLKLHPDVTVICDYAAYSDTRLGVDIGGMSVKIGLVENHRIIERRSFPITETATADSITASICELCDELRQIRHIHTIGIGVPGVINDGKIYSANLPFKNYELADVISRRLHISVNVQNDANCAALGEQLAGAGKGSDNILLVTLGTGIGLGIVIDGKIYAGKGAAGEAGHMCINPEGVLCSCGRRGCWERYASASALIASVKAAAEANPDSILAKCAGEELDGKTVFRAMERNCEVAKEVFDKYIEYLAVGIKNLIQIFDPQTILIAGGLSNSGDRLIQPLRDRVSADCDIRAAELKSEAGIIGAAAL